MIRSGVGVFAPPAPALHGEGNEYSSFVLPLRPTDDVEEGEHAPHLSP